eukprot:15342723-Ditylum_brightwellii.AAC.1
MSSDVRYWSIVSSSSLPGCSSVIMPVYSSMSDAVISLQVTTSLLLTRLAISSSEVAVIQPICQLAAELCSLPFDIFLHCLIPGSMLHRCLGNQFT